MKMAQEIEQRVEAFRRDVTQVRETINQRIVGQEDILDGALTCMIAGGNALLEGVPGLGKTMLVRSVAEAVHLRFARVQFTPDLMPADIRAVALPALRHRVIRDFEGEAEGITPDALIRSVLDAVAPPSVD